MDEEIEVRALLDGVEAPPSRVDVSRAMAEGRRGERRRRLLNASGIAAVVAAVVAAPIGLSAYRMHADRVTAEQHAGAPPGVASAQVPSAVPVPYATGACAVRELPLPAGLTDVQVTTVDPTGRYVGGHALKGQNFIPVLWTDGVPQVLSIGTTSADVNAISADGTVVGLADNGGEEWVYRYQQGKVTRLRTPAGYPHVFPAPVINGDGDVVVNAEPGGVEATKMVVLFWKSGSVAAKRLSLPSGANVLGISDGGILAGGIYIKGLAGTPYAWSLDGKPIRLMTPAARPAIAFAIRGRYAVGTLYGGAGGTPGGNTPILWDVQSGKILREWTEADMAMAVNANAWVVFDSGMVARPGSGAIPLEMLPNTTGRAVAISDTNLVVGNAYTGAKPGALNHPVTWQC